MGRKYRSRGDDGEGQFVLAPQLILGGRRRRGTVRRLRYGVWATDRRVRRSQATWRRRLMADFKTHITVSTTLGIAYGAVAFKHFGVPAPTCILAGTLCSLSGMLPDLDSDSGVPLRESLAFASAGVPMLLFERLKAFGWSPETLALVGAGIYFSIRFGVGRLLKKFTVHRGMFHSLPAAVIAGEIGFLLASGETIQIRAFKAAAIVAGFMSHLLLDEVYSVKVQGGRIGLKSSSGSAVKLWGSGTWSNFICYGMTFLLGVLVMRDPIWATVSPGTERLHQMASRLMGGVEQRTAPLSGTATTWIDRAANRMTVQTQPSATMGPNALQPGQPAATLNGTWQPTAPSQPYAPAPNNGAVPNYAGAPNYAPAQQYAAPAYAPPNNSGTTTGYAPQGGYADPNYANAGNAAGTYALPTYGTPNYSAPAYSSPRYGSPEPNAPPITNTPSYTPAPYYPPAGGSSQPYAPQPYSPPTSTPQYQQQYVPPYVPPQQQAQWPAAVPYVSPRY